MPQDSLDHEEVVKGPPECGPDIEEKLHQLSLAREDDRDDIQLQSDLDKTATDLERLVIGPQELIRGNKDEVDGLIPRMVRHGGVHHPPPYPSHHPYQRLPQQRPSPQQSQQQLWQQSPLQQQQQQPQARQQYTHVPGPIEVTATRLVQSVPQQRFDPGRNASPFLPVVNPRTQGPHEMLPPPYPGGVPTGNPAGRGAPQMHPELSETGNVNLDDVLTFIKEDLETDGEVVGPPMVPVTNKETTAGGCGATSNKGPTDWWPLFEDFALQPGVRHGSRIDTPDFRQGSSPPCSYSQLDHGAAVTSTGSSQHPFGLYAPVVCPPPDRFSSCQDTSPCGEAPVICPPPDRFSPAQDRSPCGEAPVVCPPPDRFSPAQDRSPCGDTPVVRPPPARVSPGQDGMCTNPGIPVEASGESPFSNTSSHLGPGEEHPASSTEYSDTDEEDEALQHDEDTVVHYFADLGLQQVREIYRDNQQLVVNNVNNLNHQRQTALYIAVMLRKYDIVYFLLQIGADPNIQCMEHRSDKMQAPIHKAIDLGDTQMVILLLNCDGLDIELQRVCDKKTPLMLALHGHIQGNEDRDRCEIIHHLLNCGANIDKFNESSDKTILMMAIETRDVNLVEHFLEGIGVGMSRDLINRANKVGNTSLHIAAGMKMLEKEEHLHLLTMLIHFGGNTDAPNQDLKTPKDWKRNLFDEIKRQHLTYRSHY